MKILVSPCLNIVEDGQETLAKLRQGILHPRRNLTKIVTKNKAIGFQFPELLGKRTLGNLPELRRSTIQSGMCFVGDRRFCR